MRGGTALLLWVALAGAAAAQDASVDADLLAVSCNACHGLDGKSGSAIPAIGGMDKGALALALAEYKSDKRTGTVMNRIAKGYSDEQIAALAAWFSQR